MLAAVETLLVLAISVPASVGSIAVALSGIVSANVGGISRGRAIMTGIVIAVVVRSSVGEEIRHAS